MRELSPFELANTAFLTAQDVPFGLLEPTKNGLDHSIFDATSSFREFLQANGIHDFDRQPQGQDSKAYLPALIVRADGSAIKSRMSLYRPRSKTGDPRVWVYGLQKEDAFGSVLAFMWVSSEMVVLDTSSTDIELHALGKSDLSRVLAPFVNKKRHSVESLLSLLRSIASRGFIPVGVDGDTAVGRLLEQELGIGMNSRKAPDYMGIEIKSSRKPSNKITLFSKTPDWPSSTFKNSSALLAAFGGERTPPQLYCTISGRMANPDGLRLELDEQGEWLHARHWAHASVVQWDMDALHHMLSIKHDETFWVQAETRKIDGWEHVRFVSVRHTKKPILAQFAPLIREGDITVDFTINRHAKDHGYLFRTSPKHLAQLFPPATTYPLHAADTVSPQPPIA